MIKKNIKVIGSGPTGSLLALSLALNKCNVTLVEPLSDSELLEKDKGYAVTQCTRKIFEELGVWNDIQQSSCCISFHKPNSSNIFLVHCVRA